MARFLPWGVRQETGNAKPCWSNFNDPNATLRQNASVPCTLTFGENSLVSCRLSFGVCFCSGTSRSSTRHSLGGRNFLLCSFLFLECYWFGRRSYSLLGDDSQKAMLQGHVDLIRIDLTG